MELLEDRQLLAVFTVSSLTDAPVTMPDEAPGTLRQALFDANTTPGADEIIFDSALTSGGLVQIQLSNSGQLPISGDVTITGPGAAWLTIAAFDPTPASDNGDGSRIFDIEAGSLVTISGLTLTGGDVTGGGGAIRNAGNLSLIESTISGNSAIGSFLYTEVTRVAFGGGIFSTGPLSLTGSTVSGNSVAIGDGVFGGGIHATNTLSITDSTIHGNTAIAHRAYGGGVSGTEVTTIVRSTISDNLARGEDINPEHSTEARGGGIDANHMSVSDSTVSGNDTEADYAYGGGIAVTGYLSLIRSQITGNKSEGQDYSYGGGIAGAAPMQIAQSTISANESRTEDDLMQSSGAAGGIGSKNQLTLTDSTVSNNVAGGAGGGISARGEKLIVSSTISGNQARRGGGIASTGFITIEHSTITENTVQMRGGGIQVFAINPEVTIETIHLDHTIVALNTGEADVRDDVFNPNGTTTAIHSLVGDDTNASITSAVGGVIGTGLAPVDPLLVPLANNGGPTLTHALLANSPAIDAGDSLAAANSNGVPQYDQRGMPHGRVGDGDSTGGPRIDIGAFELQSVIALPVLLGDYNLNGAVDAADYVLWRYTLGTAVENPYDGADGDGNRMIEQADYGVWQANFGATLDNDGFRAGGGAAGRVQQAAAATAPAELRLAATENDANRTAIADPGILSAAFASPIRDEQLRGLRPGPFSATGNSAHDKALLAWLQSQNVYPLGRLAEATPRHDVRPDPARQERQDTAPAGLHKAPLFELLDSW